MFTSKLLALANAQPLKAYFLQGHGESSLADNSEYGFAKFGLTLEQNDIAVNNLELRGRLRPCRRIAACSSSPRRPNRFGEPELQKIDKYLTEGGRLFALFNYASIEAPTGLEAIFQRWGVNVVADEVKDPHNSIGGQDVVVRKFNPQNFRQSAHATRAGNGVAASDRQGQLGQSARRRAAGGRTRFLQ